MQNVPITSNVLLGRIVGRHDGHRSRIAARRPGPSAGSTIKPTQLKAVGRRSWTVTEVLGQGNYNMHMRLRTGSPLSARALAVQICFSRCEVASIVKRVTMELRWELRWRIGIRG